jgi:chromosomal replication initiator protein
LETQASPLDGTGACAPEKSATLGEFLLGPENAMLRQGVGLTAAENGQPALNFEVTPLTLIARSGLGKSQLLRALAATWARQQQSDGVMFIDATDFARTYATAVKLDDVPRFRQRFQRIDCLLIDNLDALQPKDGAQQQLATIIEHRQRQQRPTVLAARQPLRQLGLSPRLSSRLASGLVIPLQQPAAATRQAILQQLCRRRRIELTPQAERLLTERGPATVPELMGFLNQLQQQLRRDTVARPMASRDRSTCEPAARPVTINAEQVQRWLDVDGGQPIDIKTVIRATARYFGLPQRNLTGSSRRKMDVLARSFAMFLIRELTGHSFQQIGQGFGGRDHTTVIHAYRKVSQQQHNDATTCQALREIRSRLNETKKPFADTDRTGRGRAAEVSPR